MVKTFDEIMEIYLKRYPHLVHLVEHRRYFARAALILAAPEGISPKDLVVLARATQYTPPKMDTNEWRNKSND